MKVTYPIECIEKCIKQVSACNLDWFVDLVVNLVKGHRLWVDQSIASHTLAKDTNRPGSLHSRHVNINV